MRARAPPSPKTLIDQNVFQVVLHAIVDDVLDLTRATARSEVQLQNMVPLNLTVFGDTGRIIQIMNNLIGNSAKFTRSGFIRVVARGTADGRMVAISVLDTGIGIPKAKIGGVFQPFEQVDMSISRKYGGFGLGLHIAQDLVRAHGGDIYVTSQEGQGSCFTFTLPAVAATAPQMERGSSVSSATHMAGPARVDAPAHVRPVETDGYDALQLSALASARIGPGPSGRSPLDTPPTALSHASTVLRSGKPWHKEKYGTHLLLSVDDDGVNHDVVEALVSANGYEARGVLRAASR